MTLNSRFYTNFHSKQSELVQAKASCFPLSCPVLGWPDENGPHIYHVVVGRANHGLR